MTTDFQSANRRETAKLVKQFREQYQQYGGVGKVITDCQQVLGKADNKHYPLMYDCYKSNRSGVFSFLKSVTLQGVKTEQPLLVAIDKVEQLKKTKNIPEWLELNEPMDLSFAPKPWHNIIARDNNKSIHVKNFEMCVMEQLREKLRTSDVYLRGADAYGDYRQTLLPWNECLPFLDNLCEAANIPNNAAELVATLRAKFNGTTLTLSVC